MGNESSRRKSSASPSGAGAGSGERAAGGSPGQLVVSGGDNNGRTVTTDPMKLVPLYFQMADLKFRSTTDSDGDPVFIVPFSSKELTGDYNVICTTRGPCTIVYQVINRLGKLLGPESPVPLTKATLRILAGFNQRAEHGCARLDSDGDVVFESVQLLKPRLTLSLPSGAATTADKEASVHEASEVVSDINFYFQRVMKTYKQLSNILDVIIGVAMAGTLSDETTFDEDTALGLADLLIAALDSAAEESAASSSSSGGSDPPRLTMEPDQVGAVARSVRM